MQRQEVRTLLTEDCVQIGRSVHLMADSAEEAITVPIHALNAQASLQQAGPVCCEVVCALSLLTGSGCLLPCLLVKDMRRGSSERQ